VEVLVSCRLRVCIAKRRHAAASAGFRVNFNMKVAALWATRRTRIQAPGPRQPPRGEPAGQGPRGPGGFNGSGSRGVAARAVTVDRRAPVAISQLRTQLKLSADSLGPARGLWTNLGRLPLRVFSIGKYAFQKKECRPTSNKVRLRHGCPSLEAPRRRAHPTFLGYWAFGGRMPAEHCVGCTSLRSFTQLGFSSSSLQWPRPTLGGLCLQ
jgi:hypothetical protein